MHTSRRLPLALAAAIVFLAPALPATPTAPVARISIEAAIDPITAEFVDQSVSRAEGDSAELLLVVLQTPGGFGHSMEKIVSRMLASRVPVVVYVAPSGAKAASAGFFILLAADVAAMAPGTNTGAAHPLMAIAGFPVEGGEAGKTLTEKITNDATAFLRSITSKRNRNVDEAEKGVRESKSFTDAEALDKHLIDFVARDQGELLERLHGFKVRMFSGQERVLDTRGKAIVEYSMTLRQNFLSAISQPNLALLLGAAGLILIYFEFSNPGFVAPGVIGGICLLLSVLGFSLLPVNLVGVLLIVLGIGLFVAEVKVQGFGILGLGGVVSLVIGMVILIDAPDPAVRIGLKAAIMVALPFAVIFLVLLAAVIQSFRQRVVTGNAGMVGLVGVAHSDVHTAGRVKIRGEYWNACSAAPIVSGRRVRVLEVQDLILNVEEVRD